MVAQWTRVLLKEFSGMWSGFRGASATFEAAQRTIGGAVTVRQSEPAISFPRGNKRTPVINTTHFPTRLIIIKRIFTCRLGEPKYVISRRLIGDCLIGILCALMVSA